MTTQKLRVHQCKHTGQSILQSHVRNNEWICLHQDTRDKELKDIEDFEKSQKATKANPWAYARTTRNAQHGEWQND